MKRISFLAILILGLFSAGAVNAQSSVENIQSINVDITIERDRNVTVKETIVYDFGSTQRHGIFRNIPVKYKDRGGNYHLQLDNISVGNENNQAVPFTTSRDGNNLSIKIGDPDVYVSGIKTYVISYETDRAINFFTDHDELYWNAVGSEWSVTINKASSSIRTPISSDQVNAVCYTGAPGSTDKNCTITKSGNTVTYSTEKIEPGNGLTIVAGLPKGNVRELTTPEKIWQAISDNWILALPMFVFGLMFWVWKKYGKNPKAKTTITAQYESPDKLTPLAAGTLVDYTTHNQDISAEIIYLATLGYIHINRIETTKLLMFKGHDYELKKLKEPGEQLTKADQILLKALFEKNEIVTLSDLKKNVSFGKELQKIKKETVQELIDKKYLPRNPWTITVICAVIGIFGGIWSAVFFGAFFGPFGGIAAGLSGAIIAGFGLLMPTRTVKGAETRALILGLKEYMNVAEKDRMKFHNAPEKNPQLFEKLLPFALALGVDKAWSKQFEGIYNTHPSWYSDSSGTAFNAYFLSSSLGDFSSSLNSAVATSTSSASSGGSGFSGGGGGGFGGGGGGSW